MTGPFPAPDRPASLDIGALLVVLVAVLAALAAAGVLAVVTAAPGRSTPAAFAAAFDGGCRRGGAAADRCGCAWRHWQQLVDEGGRERLDESLAAGEGLPEALRAALEAC